jgi:hypothetical protein
MEMTGDVGSKGKADRRAEERGGVAGLESGQVLGEV